MREAIAGEVQKAIPPIAVTAVATVSSWTMSDWMALATIGYVALQALYLLWKWYRELRGK